jgi:hypothetical protein
MEWSDHLQCSTVNNPPRLALQLTIGSIERSNE